MRGRGGWGEGGGQGDQEEGGGWVAEPQPRICLEELSGTPALVTSLWAAGSPAGRAPA